MTTARVANHCVFSYHAADGSKPLQDNVLTGPRPSLCAWLLGRGGWLYVWGAWFA